VTEELGKSRRVEDAEEQYLRALESLLADGAEKASAKLALGNLFIQREIEENMRLARMEYAETIAVIERLNAATEKYVAREGACKAASPPRVAALMLSFIAPTNSAQAFLGDLEEMFQKNVERFGEQQARRTYWSQVAGSFGPLLWEWLKRVGFVTMVVDYIRSKFGF
jgi:hypothetical protein